MLLSPLAGIFLKTWVSINPTLLSVSVEKVVCDGLRTISGTYLRLRAYVCVCVRTRVSVYQC